MDLADVALFRAIVSVGSLSAAARQMGTTPMLVSRRLAGLEAELARACSTARRGPYR